ncbi:MAG: hypothetical protein ACR2P2_14565 [Nakamurella sp.]
MARHSDGRPEPLAVELLAFAARVLRCDVAGCDRVATWRSDNQGSSKAVYRCDEHRTTEANIPGVGLPDDTDGRHREEPDDDSP